uniref:Chloride channel CLIC-like protein 1 n=1 Tax=Anopheles dirus TaxID=7168 RepID=A0A182N5W3_9DIPT
MRTCDSASIPERFMRAAARKSTSRPIVSGTSKALEKRNAEKQEHDSKWIKPGALDRWGQQQRLQEKTNDAAACEAAAPAPCECPPPEPVPCTTDITEDQRLALVFYRKLITTLFARDQLQKDPEDDDNYTTDLLLKLTSRQLNTLLDEQSAVREINWVVSQILIEPANFRRKSIARENQCERLYDMLMQLLEATTLHALMPVVLLLATFYITRLIGRFTRMHPFVVFLLLLVSITVCKNWQECNEKLANKALQGLMEASPPSTISRLWSFVAPGKTHSDGMPLPICDPLQVLIESTVSLKGMYFKATFREFIDAYKESTKDAGYFETIVIGLLLLGVAYVLLTTFLTVGIQSGFRTVGTIVAAKLRSPENTAAIGDAPAQQQQQQQQPSINLNIHIGENSASKVPLVELLRLESQRIEVVSEDLPTGVQAIDIKSSNEEMTTTDAKVSKAPPEKVEEVGSEVVPDGPLRDA